MGRATASAKSATEFWCKAGWGANLLVWATKATANTSDWTTTVRVTVASVAAKATTTFVTVATAGLWTSASWGSWGSSSHERLWEDLSWDVEVLTEVVNTFVGEGPVEVTPGVLLVDLRGRERKKGRKRRKEGEKKRGRKKKKGMVSKSDEGDVVR